MVYILFLSIVISLYKYRSKTHIFRECAKLGKLAFCCRLDIKMTISPFICARDNDLHVGSNPRFVSTRNPLDALLW